MLAFEEDNLPEGRVATPRNPKAQFALAERMGGGGWPSVGRRSVWRHHEEHVDVPMITD